MPQPAARITDLHTCPMFTGPVPHVGGPILPPGVPNVLINNLPAARVGDTTAHGGVITGPGALTVLLG